MDTSRLEALLEQLIDKQDELIGRIEQLESTLEFQIQNTNSNLDELNSNSQSNLEELTSVSRNIYDELNWWGEGHSLAKQLLIRLDAIELAVGSSR